MYWNRSEWVSLDYSEQICGKMNACYLWTSHRAKKNLCDLNKKNEVSSYLPVRVLLVCSFAFVFVFVLFVSLFDLLLLQSIVWLGSLGTEPLHNLTVLGQQEF